MLLRLRLLALSLSLRRIRAVRVEPPIQRIWWGRNARDRKSREQLCPVHALSFARPLVTKPQSALAARVRFTSVKLASHRAVEGQHARVRAHHALRIHRPSREVTRERAT